MSGNGPVEGDPRSSADDGLGRIRDYIGSSAEDYRFLPHEPAEEPAAAEPPKSPNNVEHDRFDTRLYGELYEACEQLRKLEDRDEAFHTFPELLSDFFYAFYKAAPHLAAEDRVQEQTSRANRPFVERLLEDGETRRTRINTRLDDMSAALAALAAGEKVLQEVEDRPALADFMEQATQEEEEEKEADDDKDQPAENGPEEDKPQEGAPEHDKKLQEGAPEEAQAGQSGDGREYQEPPSQPGASPPGAASAPPRDLRRAIRAAAQAGAEDAEQTREALDGWGLEPADLARVPLGERIKLARQLRNPRFKHLFDLVGRMRNLAHAKSSEKVKSRQDEVHSVELSGDLSRMLPAELAAGLASPSRAGKLDFYRRFIEGQVLSYQLIANEPQAKGPIVAAIDCSDSMGFGGAHNMQWAIAVSLALVDLACGGGATASEKKPAALVFFNEAVKDVVRFAPGERDPRKLLQVATVGASGGTRYEPAWEQAFDLCGESAHAGADVLFVTDGICRVSEPFADWVRDEKARMGTTAYSVLIGSNDSRELKRYCDEVWTTRDLLSGSDEIAGEIFGRLA